MTQSWGESEWGEWFDSTPEDMAREALYGDADQHAQDLMFDAVFYGDDDKYVELVDYLWDTYGVEFEDVFDWESAREAYDAA